MADIDPNWPEPEADGWQWRKVDVTCSTCGATHQLHELRPEQLAQGDKWECTTCGAANHRGDTPVAASNSDFVLECGHCHNTYDPDSQNVGADGEWTCPNCSTPNRDVQAAEKAQGGDSAGKVDQ